MQVIVTGAAGSLGHAVVAAFENGGHQVIAFDRHEGDVPGTGVSIVAADLSDPQNCRDEIGRQLAGTRDIDAVVHLVGGFNWLPIAESTLDDWWELYAVNIGTTINVIHAAVPHLRDGGSILCVGAASAQPAAAGMGPYGAAKSGVARIVESLSEELKGRRIRVNGVAPAIIDTPRNRADMPDADPSLWTRPEAIADVLLFLAGPEARAINGALIPVTNNG